MKIIWYLGFTVDAAGKVTRYERDRITGKLVPVKS